MLLTHSMRCGYKFHRTILLPLLLCICLKHPSPHCVWVTPRDHSGVFNKSIYVILYFISGSTHIFIILRVIYYNNDITDALYWLCLFVFWHNSLQWAMVSSFTRFLDHTQWRTTAGRTPPDEWSARRRDLYLITHMTHNRQTSMPPVGFKPTISAGKWPQTYALDRAAVGTGPHTDYTVQNCYYLSKI